VFEFLASRDPAMTLGRPISNHRKPRVLDAIITCMSLTSIGTVGWMKQDLPHGMP
jgi:hypothetical protein